MNIEGKRERTKATNRAAILASARQTFLKFGYDATAVRDIVRGTGLAAGTFYNYFPDKEAVFRAIIGDYLEKLSTRISKKRQRASDLKSFIRPAYSLFFNAIIADPEAYELTKRNEDVLRQMYDSSFMDVVSLSLHADIQWAIDRKILPPLKSEMLTAAFIGVAYELGQQMLRQNLEPEYVAEFASNLFMGGLMLPVSQSSGDTH